jgi:hypothetical protein
MKRFFQVLVWTAVLGVAGTGCTSTAHPTSVIRLRDEPSVSSATARRDGAATHASNPWYERLWIFIAHSTWASLDGRNVN